jgi:Asp-tRNA(Asn)/Glu-tRNA(Gln) amidotransferase A subunit family amidase
MMMKHSHRGIRSMGSTPRSDLVASSLSLAETQPAVFTTLYASEALAVASAADTARQNGRPISALAGLPISIKDLFDTTGEVTLAGSVVLRDRPTASEDAPVVARLRAADVALLGKTNMTEFAFSGVGINPHYGTPGNPADPTRIPGGSSSGAAVSVAGGSCVAAIGSDTGGSVRIPAALCGLVGFKPTMRRVPVAGIVPLSPSLDTLGPLAHTVEDCLLIDSVIADTPLQPERVTLAGLRLAVPLDVVLDDMDMQVAHAFSQALSRLSEAGVEVIDVPMPMLREAPQINRFSPIEAYAWHQTLLETREHAYDHRVVQRIRQGEHQGPEVLIELRAARADWTRRVGAALAGFDALLMPTVPIIAPHIAPLLASDTAFFEANRLLLRNPSLINLLDGCAISLPCHRSGELPVGLTVAGLAMTDAKLMAIAQFIEDLLRKPNEFTTAP